MANFHFMQSYRNTIIASAVLLILAFVSFLPVSSAVSKDNYGRDMQKYLDSKRNQALLAFGAATGASIAISLLPGDVGTAISEKLADVAGFFMLVTGAILIEKIVLAVSGIIAFKILIPLSLLFFIFYLWAKQKWDKSSLLFTIAFKCLVFGIIIFIAVPSSLKLSALVETDIMYKYTNIDNSIAQVKNQTKSINTDTEAIGKDPEARAWWDVPGKIANGVKNLATKAGQSAKSALEKGQNALSSLLNMLICMVITTFIIPLLTIMGFAALLKAMWGIDAFKKANC
ncbi:MAG: hypothetical protein Ta2F_13720 [Termitinemataceae bacterium]|nr:MAG: hypothetical protein Ta2F_13720 [Termitinemataceae bacterium]